LPIPERRRKSCVLLDVASLLTSFEFVRDVALRRATVARPEQREKLDAALGEWLESSTTALLTGYRIGIGRSRCVPADEKDLLRLIRLYRLNRALKEVENELVGRTLWTGVPLALVLREAEQA